MTTPELAFALFIIFLLGVIVGIPLGKWKYRKDLSKALKNKYLN